MKEWISRKEKVEKVETWCVFTCDLCARVTEKELNPDLRKVNDHSVCWSTGSEPLEFQPHQEPILSTVSLTCHESYYDGNTNFFDEDLVWHICPDCFKDKLVPFLESQKIKPTNE